MLTPEVSKERVDTFLSEHFATLEEVARAQGPSYQQLVRMTGEVALAGGKRLRPHMSMLMYEAYSGKSGETILKVSAAQEVMHLAMLVHDDIMDGDLVRHGRPNVTARALEAYQPFVADAEERRRRAEHAALLMGDLLIGEAYGLTEDVEGIDHELMVRTRRLFRTATRTVVGGQLHDIEAPIMGDAAISPRSIAHDKTAHYTFVTPLLVGATLGGAADEELEKLQAIGEKTGIAYQLRDDILGVFGDPEVTGKSADGDLREGKRTLLTEVFSTVSSTDDIAQFEALQQEVRLRPNDQGTLKHMRSLLEPAHHVVEQEIEAAHDEVRNLIGELAIRRSYRASLQKFVRRSLTRTH